MIRPEHIELIGQELAIRWSDQSEDYVSCEHLRACSPSAENTGEQDLLGRRYGGTDQRHFPGVMVKGWRLVGGYALQFDFTDGHNTGLYTFPYLKAICQPTASC